MSLFRKITVHSTERAIEYVDGVSTRVLEPGRHRVPRRATYQRVSSSSASRPRHRRTC